MSASPSRSRWLRLGLGALGLLGVAGLVAGGLLYWSLVRDLPDLQSIEDYAPALTTVVHDRHGVAMGEFYEERRQIVPLAEVPLHLVQAFIAAEDDSFYEHAGIDVKSILRAAWANFRAGDEVQGASTITQQTVKQLLLSSEQTYRRKSREMILARRLEERFSKDDILFLYLNQIYFGSGAHGVAEAARTYFGKPVKEISVAEGAMLAGLPKAPGRHSPYRNPEAAEERRRYVLRRMHEEGYLDEPTWREATENPPELHTPPEREAFAAAAYFTEEVRKELVETLGNDVLLRGGLTVVTTADLELQGIATRAVRAGIEAHDRRQGWKGPIRQVGRGALAAEAVALAKRNGLRDDEDTLAAALPADRPLLGVVTSVSRKKARARVAFAPGLEGLVHFDAVSWARRQGSTAQVKFIDQVFAVGDVAHFVVSDTEAGDEPALALHQRPPAQGALLSIDVATGDVLAMVGGYDFEASEFNRATQARRQPGSAFKPIIYAAAIEKGMTPATILYDRPVIYEDPETGFTWRPENYGRRFLGPIVMSEALARSVNNATIHLLRDVGVGRVVDLSRRLGIRSPLVRDLSLALGSSPVSLLELTNAYSVFAAGGRRVFPRFINRVLDRDGNVLLENVSLEGPPEAASDDGIRAPAVAAVETPSGGAPDIHGSRVMEPVEAYLGAHLLRGVVTHPQGTGRRAAGLGAVAGKTGTTNEQGDAWFLGFSTDVVTGVWVGFDEKQVLGPGETGGRAALPIWIEFMEAALAKRGPRELPVPPGVVFARIDGKTGLIATEDAENAQFLAFAEGTAPARTGETTGRSPRDRGRRVRLDF